MSKQITIEEYKKMNGSEINSIISEQGALTIKSDDRDVEITITKKNDAYIIDEKQNTMGSLEENAIPDINLDKCISYFKSSRTFLITDEHKKQLDELNKLLKEKRWAISFSNSQSDSGFKHFDALELHKLYLDENAVDFSLNLDQYNGEDDFKQFVIVETKRIYDTDLNIINNAESEEELMECKEYQYWDDYTSRLSEVFETLSKEDTKPSKKKKKTKNRAI